MGVLRDRARAPQQPTNPQTGHQMTKMTKMTKNANFGPDLVVLGQKILIFTGESKSFGTHITEKPPTHLVCIVFWLGLGRNGPRMRIIGPK